LFLDVFNIKVQATAHGWSPHWGDARCSCYVTAAWLGPAPLPGCWCYSAGDSAAWLVPSLVRCPLLVLCHGSVAGPSTPSWVLGLQCRGLSCMAGPLTSVMPAARALSRQRGWAQHPFLGAGAIVPGTQLHGWSPHWCDARCSCLVTAAWYGPAPLPGCWCYCAGDSAAWLVPSLV
jgi:hypothetical protein